MLVSTFGVASAAGRTSDRMHHSFFSCTAACVHSLVVQPDQGSGHFAATVSHLKSVAPHIMVECLTPDFRGNADCVDVVARSGLDVFAHNVETTERMQGRVRDHRAGWRQSLSVLERAKATVPALVTKTSIMLGVGEGPEDLRAAMAQIRSSGVDIITFGQYLRPSKRHMPVDRYVEPAEFDAWAAEARAMGFLGVFSGPLVRSSFKAGELFIEQILRNRAAVAAAAGGPTAAAASATMAKVNAAPKKQFVSH